MDKLEITLPEPIEVIIVIYEEIPVEVIEIIIPE